jgi:hypothetical protein
VCPLWRCCRCTLGIGSALHNGNKARRTAIRAHCKKRRKANSSQQRNKNSIMNDRNRSIASSR